MALRNPELHARNDDPSTASLPITILILIIITFIKRHVCLQKAAEALLLYNGSLLCGLVCPSRVKKSTFLDCYSEAWSPKMSLKMKPFGLLGQICLRLEAPPVIRPNVDTNLHVSSADEVAT